MPVLPVIPWKCVFLKIKQTEDDQNTKKQCYQNEMNKTIVFFSVTENKIVKNCSCFIHDFSMIISWMETIYGEQYLYFVLCWNKGNLKMISFMNTPLVSWTSSDVKLWWVTYCTHLIFMTGYVQLTRGAFAMTLFLGKSHFNRPRPQTVPLNNLPWSRVQSPDTPLGSPLPTGALGVS